MLDGWRRSAAYRIGFAWAGAFASAVALLGVVVFVAMHLAFQQQLDAMIGDESNALAAEYRSDGLGELQTAIAEREAAKSPNRMMYAVYDRHGRRLAGSLQTGKMADGIHDIVFVDPTEGNDRGRAVFRTLDANTSIAVAADREWLERVDAILLALFGIMFLVILALGVIGGAVLGKYLRERLRTISDGARAIMAGDTRQRMVVSRRGDEFDAVAAALNKMLDRIEMLIENLRQVSSDIAHDLRTPLTRLRNYLETRPDADDFSSGAIDRVDELLALFGAILRISEVESGETKRFFAPLDLSRLVNDLADSYQPSFSESGRELLWSVEPSVHIDGDSQLIVQALANLLDNAVRHTPPGTVVRMTLTTNSRRAVICVVDNGKGIPKSQRSWVVRRFQRLDESRSTPGFGLGLNLTAAVAKLHGGELNLGDAGPGLEARIDLPFSSRRQSEDRNDQTGH